MVRIEWKNTSGSLRIHGKRFMPKRPVNWRGQVWMKFNRGTEIETVSREWKTGSPIFRKEAQHILRAMLQDIIDQSGDDAFDAGF